MRQFEAGLSGDRLPRQERSRRHLAEAVVGPLGVVVLEPLVADRLCFLDRSEQVGVEHLFAIAAIEPLDAGGLVGLARLDWMHRDVAFAAPGPSEPPRSAPARCPCEALPAHRRSRPAGRARGSPSYSGSRM